MTSCDPRTAVIGVEIFQFEIGFLPPYYKKKAESELNDVEDTRKRCIQKFRDMIEADTSISGIDFHEDFLLQHLRARKFDVAKSFEVIKNFVTLIKKNPAMFSNYNFDNAVKAIRSGALTLLPWRCHEGCVILYVQLGNWDTDELPMDEVKRLLVVVFLQILRDPMTQVNGIKVIIDIQSSSLRYLKECTLSNMFMLYHATQNCAPGRYKGIHFLNHNVFFKSVWLCIKQFMSQKLQNRVHFHSSPSKLLNFFPKMVIPEKYGGDLVVPDQSEWLRKMMSPKELAMLGGGALNYI